jgi:hypothetical protein
VNKDAKYLCFRPEYGFAQYNSDSGSICYTQIVSAAHEATKDDWSDVIGLDLTWHTFIPAEIWVSKLERTIETLKLISSELSEALSNLVPERNCSCHLNPPCSQCVEFGQAFFALKQYKETKL